VRTALGIAFIVAASLLLVLVAFVLRPRVLARTSLPLAALGGAGLAAGALLVQPHASAADWSVAVPAMALLAPAHIRIVLGAFGPLKKPGLLAEDAQDA
jgi:1-acyl-sn-glycerol-3-phosphate acyltransferase